MSKKSNKRGRYIIDKDFQYGVIGRIVALSVFMIVFSLFFFGIIYHYYGDIQVDVAICQPLPFALSGAAAAATKGGGFMTKSNLFDLLWPVLSVSVAAALLISSLLGLLFSHKMAGPVHRMRKELLSIRNGNLSNSFTLRDNDVFQHLAKDIDELRRHLRASIEELKDIHQSLEQGDPEKRQESLRRLGEIISVFKIDS